MTQRKPQSQRILNESIASDLDSALRDAADPRRAPQQQAYMKSAMPFIGVTVPEVRKRAKTVYRNHPIDSAGAWRRVVQHLWRNAAYREVRYAALEAIGYSRYRRFLNLDALPLIEELVTTGAWWDFVDQIATQTVGKLLADHPNEMDPVLRDWSMGDDIWLRRTAILAQLKFKDRTDEALLFDCIEPSVGDPEFFLGKAIGWALREYSKTSPDAVTRYVTNNEARLSNLSVREALKVIKRRGGS